MKRIQLKIEKIFVVEVEDDIKATDIATIHNKLVSDIERENTKPSIIFFEGLEVICSECGISLNLDEEKEDGICVQCNNKRNLKVEK